MPDEKTGILTLDEIVDALLEGTPAAQDIAAIDLTWIVEHDEENRSLKHWAIECLKAGAVAKKRGMENVVATRAAKQASKDAEANMAKFAQVLAQNPKIMTEARSGNIELLLKTAASFKIPTDVVLGFLAVTTPAAEPAKEESAA